MDIIFFLLPVSLLLGLIALCGYLWSVKSGQMEDLDTPAHRILFEDEQIVDGTEDLKSILTAETQKSQKK